MIKGLENVLKRSIKKHNVPGASVAVLRRKRIVGSAAAGVVNLNTQVQATRDALFQIGSITKPMTATMVMQLNEEGKLDLDDPILQYLPSLRNADMLRLKRVTIRHLLAHLSGIDGDYFPETDVGTRAIEHHLDLGAMLPSLFEPGAYFSYSNHGYAILGRLIEVLDARSFDDSLKARIFDPLGMEKAFSKLEDTIRFRVAIGHVAAPKRKSKLAVPDDAYLNIGGRAAGATPTMTAEELLKFAAAHMHDGLGINRKRLLKRSSVRTMQRAHFKSSANPHPTGYGLGWGLSERGGYKSFGHSGATVGQVCRMTVFPSEQLAIAVLTNARNGEKVFTELEDYVLKQLIGIDPVPKPEPDPDARPNPSEVLGHYENINVRVEVLENKGRFFTRGYNKNMEGPEDEYELKFVNPRFALLENSMIEWYGPRGKPADGILMGSRMFKRIC